MHCTDILNVLSFKPGLTEEYTMLFELFLSIIFGALGGFAGVKLHDKLPSNVFKLVYVVLVALMLAAGIALCAHKLSDMVIISIP